MAKKNAFGFGLASAVIGLCVGFMTGLSVSPVVQTVLTSVLAIATALVSVLSGMTLKDEEAGRTGRIAITPMPTVLFMLGLVGGACVGILTRTNDWLGPDVPMLAQRAGMRPEEIYKRMVEQMYGSAPAGEPSKSDSPKKASGEEEKKKAAQGGNTVHGVLYTETLQSECQQLTLDTDVDRRQHLKISQDPKLRALTNIPDDRHLEALVKTLCEPR